MRTLLLSAAIMIASATTVVASPRAEALLQAIGADRMIEMMRLEGLRYGENLADDMFPGRGGPRWQAMVSDIYDADTMLETFSTEFADAFDPAFFDQVEAFYASELGQEVVNLELATREAFLDESVEEAAKDAISTFRADQPEVYARVAEFIELNNLIDENVIGSLNSNYAFMVGLADGGGFPGTLTEQQILADLVSQEPEIRESSTEWLYGYLLMAYGPLAAEDMETYLDLSRSEAGQALTRALFAGFDTMFTDISRALGLSASQFMVGQEL